MSDELLFLFNDDPERKAEQSQPEARTAKRDEKVSSVRPEIARRESMIKIIIHSRYRQWHRRTASEIIKSLETIGLNEHEIDHYIEKFKRKKS